MAGNVGETTANSSVADTWDAIAASYDSTRLVDPIYLACCRAIVERVEPLPAGTRILDAGCGTGIVSLELARRKLELHALDYSAASLGLLAKKLEERHLDARLVQGDIRKLEYPDDFFDVVVCANTLQHLEPGSDQRTAARELMRVLKPGGKFAISAHHYSRVKQRHGWIKEGKPGEPGVDYIFRFSREEFAELMQLPARVVAVGFYSLARPSRVFPALQNAASRYFGRLLAQARMGHMLLAYGVKPRS